MRYERIKGRQYMLAMLKSIEGGLTDHVALRILLDNVEKAMIDRPKPEEYAAGMREIIDEAWKLVPASVEWQGEGDE